MTGFNREVSGAAVVRLWRGGAAEAVVGAWAAVAWGRAVAGPPFGRLVLGATGSQQTLQMCL